MKYPFIKTFLFFHILVFALNASPDKISGWIHRGNGDVFPGEINYSDQRIISVRRVGLDYINPFIHITPLMIDLNIYSSENPEYTDSLLLDRGIGLYLAEAKQKILLRTVRNILLPDTLGLLVELPEQEGYIHHIYQMINDVLNRALPDSPNLYKIPDFQAADRLFWKDIPGEWIPAFRDLLIHDDRENIWIIREGSLSADMIFGNIRCMVMYSDLKKYETDRPAESDWSETLGNAGILFPKYWSFGAKDSFFDAQTLQKEIFLQLMTVLPAEFLNIENRFGLLIPGYSASFVVYSNHQNQRGFVLENVIVEGVYVR